jgi:hypothetical protein
MNRSFKVSVASAFALAMVLSWLLDPPALGFEPLASSARSGRSFGCTVKRVEVGARRLDVIVAVGHALRIVTMDLSPACGASAQGHPIRVDAIRPGDVVRVEYQLPSGAPAAPARGVVTKIDLVLAAPEPRRR